MKIACAAIVVIACCWSAFGQEQPLQLRVSADGETVKLQQRISQLVDRVERVESQLAQMKQVTAAIGLSQLDHFGRQSDRDAEAAEIRASQGTYEGMMIDAIQHRMRWQRHSRLRLRR